MKLNHYFTCYPYELLGESPREQDIAPTEYESDDQNEREQDRCIGVQTKTLGIVVDAAAIEAFERVVAVERDPRDDYKSAEHSDEL